MKQHVIVICKICMALMIGCAPATMVNLKDNAALDKLAICVSYEPGFPSEYTDAVDEVLKNYIDSKHPRNFRLVNCSDSSQSGTMKLHFTGLGLVTSQQQTGATLGNVVGLLVLPLALASSESDNIFFFG